MKFFNLQFLLWPDDGCYEPKLVAKMCISKQSVGFDCDIDKNKYTFDILLLLTDQTTTESHTV
jgi:hypothetical protein